MSAHRLTIASESPAATRAFGRRLGQALEPGACLALIGPLGAGKTQLVKGIAAGASVPDHVTVNSPTFVLVNEYPGRLRIYHIDAYRLDSAAALEAIGLTDMIGGDGAVIVEWADRARRLLPADHLAVYMEHRGPSARRITAVAGGAMSCRILSAATASV